MNAFVKAYPRARVSRHPKINGWVIDLVQREGARPRRVAATYASPVFADRAARVKLGAEAPKEYVPRPPMFAQPGERPPARNFEVFQPKAALSERSTGKCEVCGRPMRPAGSKAADYPGTTLRQRDGLCQTDYQKTKREGAAA